MGAREGVWSSAAGQRGAGGCELPSVNAGRCLQVISPASHRQAFCVNTSLSYIRHTQKNMEKMKRVSVGMAAGISGF